MVFTRKPLSTLAAGALLAVAAVSGCSKGPPDPARYGEVITKIPERLKQPYPTPQLDEPAAEGQSGGE